MRVLGFDTATLNCSVALIDDEQLISVYSLNSCRSHSQRLLSSIHGILAQAGFTLEDLSAMAVAIGPGSFTGLRIGLSTAKGLAFATGKPMVGVQTLDAAASSLALTDRLLCPVIDARKGQIYTALYRYRDACQLQKLTPDMALYPQDLCELIREPVIFVGNGIEAYGPLWKERLKGLAHFASFSSHAPWAAAVARLGLERLRRGEADDPHTILPFYIRLSEAELQRKGSRISVPQSGCL